MKQKRAMDLLLVEGEGLFNNGCFLGEMVTWMENAYVCNPMHIKFVAN
jgi:hypothetical protein